MTLRITQFVLDTASLGDDITNHPSLVDGPLVAGSAAADDIDCGPDALILVHGDVAEGFSSFESPDAGLQRKEVTHARIYVGGAIQALLTPDAIPEKMPDLDLSERNVTPFEEHILSLVNAHRPVGRIRRRSGMEHEEVATALAMLADKGIIRLAGYVDEERKERARRRRRERV